MRFGEAVLWSSRNRVILAGLLESYGMVTMDPPTVPALVVPFSGNAWGYWCTAAQRYPTRLNV